MILISATNTLRTTAIHRLVLVSEIILSMTKFLQKLPFVDIIYHVNNSQQCICASCCNRDPPKLKTKQTVSVAITVDCICYYNATGIVF